MAYKELIILFLFFYSTLDIQSKLLTHITCRFFGKKIVFLSTLERNLLHFAQLSANCLRNANW
jgi:hypothetical protein